MREQVMYVVMNDISLSNFMTNINQITMSDICTDAKAFCREITNFSYPKSYKQMCHNYADILRLCSQIYCRMPMQNIVPHICPSLFSVLLPHYG